MTDKQTDARLRRTYNISLEEYNQILEDQDGCCAICRRPPGKIRLSVDHDHRYDRVVVVWKKREPGVWIGIAEIDGSRFQSCGPRKGIIRKKLKLMLRRKSVRGLLDWQCNKALQYYRDMPERLRAAADYLERFRLKVLHEKVA